MKPHNSLGPKSTDLYQTPKTAVDLLTKYIDLPRPIWEPAAGLGAISKVLDAIPTSIETGQDFLTYIPDFNFESIVTNPPFSIKDKFIQKCFDYGKPFCLLMPLMSLEGVNRQAIWKQVNLTILLPKRRMRFMFFDGTISYPNMASAWFCVERNGPHETKIIYDA